MVSSKRGLRSPHQAVSLIRGDPFGPSQFGKPAGRARPSIRHLAMAQRAVRCPAEFSHLASSGDLLLGASCRSIATPPSRPAEANSSSSRGGCLKGVRAQPVTSSDPRHIAGGWAVCREAGGRQSVPGASRATRQGPQAEVQAVSLPTAWSSSPWNSGPHHRYSGAGRPQQPRRLPSLGGGGVGPPSRCFGASRRFDGGRGTSATNALVRNNDDDGRGAGNQRISCGGRSTGGWSDRRRARNRGREWASPIRRCMPAV